MPKRTLIALNRAVNNIWEGRLPLARHSLGEGGKSPT